MRDRHDKQAQYDEPDAGKYTQLPEPIRLEDTITSDDVEPIPEVKGDDRREREWMLRNAGGVG